MLLYLIAFFCFGNIFYYYHYNNHFRNIWIQSISACRMRFESLRLKVSCPSSLRMTIAAYGESSRPIVCTEVSVKFAVPFLLWRVLRNTRIPSGRPGLIPTLFSFVRHCQSRTMFGLKISTTTTMMRVDVRCWTVSHLYCFDRSINKVDDTQKCEIMMDPVTT